MSTKSKIRTSVFRRVPDVSGRRTAAMCLSRIPAWPGLTCRAGDGQSLPRRVARLRVGSEARQAAVHRVRRSYLHAAFPTTWRLPSARVQRTRVTVVQDLWGGLQAHALRYGLPAFAKMLPRPEPVRCANGFGYWWRWRELNGAAFSTRRKDAGHCDSGPMGRPAGARIALRPVGLR